MANVTIAEVECPVCGAAGAALRETKKGKAYVMCDGCGSQTFARGAASDRALRGRIKGGAAGVTLPAADMEASEEPQRNETPAPAAAVTVRTHSSEGETITEEKTVFDHILEWSKRA